MQNSSPGYLLHFPDHSLVGKRSVIGGVPIKCISSNIRQADIAWDSYEIIPGIGKEGNLVVVEALSDNGFRTEIEDQTGKNIHISKGDTFIAVLASRHSGTSESGDVPIEGISIKKGIELHLLSAGGIVGIKSGVPAGHKEPMRLACLGLVAKNNKMIDLISLRSDAHQLKSSAPIVLVCGTSAEVGKTTTATSLIRALADQGLNVAAAKISGTGRMRDILALREAGASMVLDFPEVGLATTYTSAERYIPAIHNLFYYLNNARPDIIIAEAGGDIIEANIPTLLKNQQLMQHIKALCLVSGDVLGMMGAVTYLKQYVEEIPIYLTDPKGRNPVTTRARVAHELPNYTCFGPLNSTDVNVLAHQLTKELL